MITGSGPRHLTGFHCRIVPLMCVVHEDIECNRLRGITADGKGSSIVIAYPRFDRARRSFVIVALRFHEERRERGEACGYNSCKRPWSVSQE